MKARSSRVASRRRATCFRAALLRALPLVLILFLAEASAGSPQAAGPGRISIESVEVRPVERWKNLAFNGGFEPRDHPTWPTPWAFDAGGSGSECVVETEDRHSGQWCLKFTRTAPHTAELYGWLRLHQSARLRAGQTYTLSAWVRTTDANAVWIGGGPGWNRRLLVPDTDGVWRRISMSFTPEEDEEFGTVVVVDAPTTGVWVDDVRLEEGETPSPIPGAQQIMAAPAIGERIITPDDGFTLTWFILNDMPRPPATLRLSAGASPAVWRLLPLPRGTFQVTVRCKSSDLAPAPLPTELQLRSGTTVLAASRATTTVLGRSWLVRRMQALRQTIQTRTADFAAGGPGRELDYGRIRAAALAHGLQSAEMDLADGRLLRAHFQMDELDTLLRLPPEKPGRDRLSVRLRSGEGRAYLSPPAKDQAGGAGPEAGRPYLIGYGHFDQVQNDVAKLPDLGCNLIQVELGPRQLFPSPDVIDRGFISALQSLLDRAEREGVAVDLLLSPHYMPEWYIERHPHLKKRREGFLQHCIHAPETASLMRRFLRELLPPLAGRRALAAICLSNEPMNVEEPCDFAAQSWRQFLRSRHGTIDLLNSRWGSEYSGFDGVLLPDPLDSAVRAHPSGRWTDFARFNREVFAGWHRMISEEVRATAPGIPVHAKQMAWSWLNGAEDRSGVDPLLFARSQNLAGYNSHHSPPSVARPQAREWLQTLEALAVLRGIGGRRIYNSEFHLAPDAAAEHIPGGHFYSALLSAAVHGQDAAVLWLWQRATKESGAPEYGIYHRPVAVDAIGRASFDLNRLRPEIAALQEAEDEVAILESITSRTRTGDRSPDVRQRLFSALCMAGVRPVIITETALEEGRLPKAGILLLPGVTHLSPEALSGLQSYRGRLLVCADGPLELRDEYDQLIAFPRLSEAPQINPGRLPPAELAQRLLPVLRAAGAAPLIRPVNKMGQPLENVVSHSVRSGDHLLVALCNYGAAPAEVRLLTESVRIQGPFRDLITDQALNGAFALAPMQFRLLRLPLSAPRRASQLRREAGALR